MSLTNLLNKLQANESGLMKTTPGAGLGGGLQVTVGPTKQDHRSKLNQEPTTQLGGQPRKPTNLPWDPLISS